MNFKFFNYFQPQNRLGVSVPLWCIFCIPYLRPSAPSADSASHPEFNLNALGRTPVFTLKSKQIQLIQVKSATSSRFAFCLNYSTCRPARHLPHLPHLRHLRKMFRSFPFDSTKKTLRLGVSLLHAPRAFAFSGLFSLFQLLRPCSAPVLFNPQSEIRIPQFRPSGQSCPFTFRVAPKKQSGTRRVHGFPSCVRPSTLVSARRASLLPTLQ